MRGYWIKIGLKALAIFIVGMILVTGFRKAKGSINHAINSSDPIPIPVMGVVPFNLDNQKLGSVNRVEFLRSDPEHISGVRVVVKLASGTSTDILSRCQLLLDDVEHINDRTTFKCTPDGSTPGGLEPFGVVAIKNSSDTFPLLLPASVTNRLRETSFSFRDGKFDISSPPSSHEQMVSKVDSLHTEVEALIDAQSDSIDNLKDLSGELEDSASDGPRDQRRSLQRRADSVRAVMRSMVDRMKANEGRMHALEKLSMMQEMRRDWKPAEGVTISDSVSSFVNAELARVQADLERQGITGVQVNVQLDSISAAAMREGMRAGRAARARTATGVGSGSSSAATTSVEPAAAPKAKATPAPKVAPPTPPAAPAPAVEKP